jgi:hypothetical protein
MDPIITYILKEAFEALKGKGYKKISEVYYQKKLNNLLYWFNNEFIDTGIDCGSFEKFLKESKVVTDIINFINPTYSNIKALNKDQLVQQISKLALAEVNRKKVELGFREEPMEIYTDYFQRLIEILEEFIFDSLSIENKHMTEIIIRDNQEIDKSIERKIDQSTSIIQGDVAKFSSEILEKLTELEKQINNGGKFYEQQTNLSKEVKFPLEQIKQFADDNAIDYNYTEEITIKHDEKRENVKGFLVIKANDFIKGFKSTNELFEYAYREQISLNLEPIYYKYTLGNKVINERYIDKDYSGEVVKLSFESLGDAKLIISKQNTGIKELELDNSIQVIPQEMEFLLNAELENKAYETLLSGIRFCIESREVIDDRVLITISNSSQKTFPIRVRIAIEIEGVGVENIKVVGSKFFINPMVFTSNFSIIKSLQLLKKIRANERIIVRNMEDGSVFFEGNLTLDDDFDIEERYAFYTKIAFIEDNLKIRFSLPNTIELEEIKKVESLYIILMTGKEEFSDLTMTSSFNQEIDIGKFEDDKTYMFTFRSNDKYQILDQEIDLGEQLYVLSEVNIQNTEKNILTISTVEKSRKFRVFLKYYDDNILDNILEKEGISKNKDINQREK